MPDPKIDYTGQLAEWVRMQARNDTAGPYTTLSPKLGSDGTATMLVKDKRHSGLLEIVVREVQ